jgi:16S rRNA (guanine527-N7)-methyltransferase
VAVLVAPVLPLLPFVEGPLLDVGSGNGSPGLVLALLRPELSVTLLEPRAKRWAFLCEAARAAGRPDLRVLRLRHDAYSGPPAATVTLRALRLPAAQLVSLMRPEGQLLALGAAPEPHPELARRPAPPGVHRYQRRQRST